MSSISLNICTSEPSEPSGASGASEIGPQQTPGENQKRRRSKWFRKKRQRLEGPGGPVEQRHKPKPPNHQRPGGGPVENGGAARPRPVFPIFHPQKQSLPRPPFTSSSSTSSTSSSSSLHLPSLTVTVNNNKGLQGKPKQPTTVKSTSSSSSSSTPSASCSRRPPPTSARLPTKFVAIDCEMVGTGPKGSVSQLARCSIVSYDGDVVYDKFINPSVPVTDYRTRWSGIRRSDLVNAKPYAEARKEILRLLMGKVVVGHAIHNDFKVLGYSHPTALTRDTSRIPLLNQKAGIAAHECASLKRLTKTIFNRDIQTGKRGHSSVEDAKATMELYKVVEEEWERRLASTLS